MAAYMDSKPKILVLIGYYLPGYKAGGPVKTIANIVDNLSPDFEFWIITRNHDLGSHQSYPSITVNGWQFIKNVHVFYASSEKLSFKGITEIINNTPHDLLYLNSYFDPVFSIAPLFARRMGMLNEKKPVLLAPRGEFSPKALQLKGLKKRIYILLSSFVGLYKGIYWHASSKCEFFDIKSKVSVVNHAIFIALDLPAKISSAHIEKTFCADNSGLRVIFLSRISPMKNLDYALNVLKKVTVPVTFDIYGPLEDEVYWQSCLKQINAMPKNILIDYRGAVLPENVAETFAKYDVFLFPTRGENYGHVIAESLSVGTPILLSDRTPWRDLEHDGLGKDISLDDMDDFVIALNKFASLSLKEKNASRGHVVSKARERLLTPKLLEENRQVFFKAIQEFNNGEFN